MRSTWFENMIVLDLCPSVSLVSNYFCLSVCLLTIETHPYMHGHTSCMLKLLHTRLHPSRTSLLLFAEALSHIINFQHYNSALSNRGCVCITLRETWFSIAQHISLSFYSLIQVMGCL